MNLAKEYDDGVGDDLFAYEISNGQTCARDRTLAGGLDLEDFPNAYAEASQARMSSRRPPSAYCDKSGGTNQSATPVIIDRAVLEQAPADNRTQTVFAHLEPAKVMADAPRAGKEHSGSAVSPRMMPAAEVAAYLHMSVSKVWRLAKRESGFPRPVRIGGSTRWDRQVIDRYLDSLQTRRLPSL